MAFEDGLERRIRSSCLDITPRESVRRVYAESNQRLGMLAPGAEFYGFQSSKVSNEEFRYEVSVEIKEVNVRDAHLAGFLKISNLTQVHAEQRQYDADGSVGVSRADDIFRSRDCGDQESIPDAQMGC